MHPLDTIRSAFTLISAGLGLSEEEANGIFDPELLAYAAQLEDGICREFSLSLAQRAVALRLALKGLLEETEADTFARALHELDAIVEGLESELEARPDGRLWVLSRQFHDVARHLATPSSAENQGFRRLPEMLFSSEWVSREVLLTLGRSGLALPREIAGREFRQTQTRRWLNRARRSPAGALGVCLEQLRNDIEFRSRQIWFFLKSGGNEPNLTRIYGWAHGDLYPSLGQSVAGQAVEVEVARLASIALDLKLPDFALCFEGAEWMAQYAMNYLMPPAPNDWAVRQGGELQRVLRGRLSRWYFYPFAHKLEPLEMAASVLRVGRPLFYERNAAHAWLEYGLFQGFSVATHNAPLYLEILATLEKDFLTLFDGYLLRLMYYPRLRAPEGWCTYLEALTSLHYRGGAMRDLAEFRREFLGQRGLRSPVELLYRATESHGSVN